MFRRTEYTGAENPSNPNPREATMTTAAAAAPATDKQLQLIRRLAAERQSGATIIEIIEKPSGVTKYQASKLIDALFQMPRTAPANTTTVTEPGMYRTADGAIYKVQKSKEGQGLYAKRLTPITGERLNEADNIVGWDFQYAPGAIKTLKASERMTLEEAKAFGVQYGICCVCGKLLKDATSVAQGIGPVCAGRV